MGFINENMYGTAQFSRTLNKHYRVLTEKTFVNSTIV